MNRTARAFATPACGWPRFLLYAALCCVACLPLL
ncbi:hypothetical protein J2Y58_001870 [Sphingomonas sp. BE138]|nr:hypothetical protein [Sphingomonas sp. BE138]